MSDINILLKIYYIGVVINLNIIISIDENMMTKWTIKIVLKEIWW